MTSVVVTLPTFSDYIKTESDNFLTAQNNDYLITEDQPGVQSIVYLGNIVAKGGAGAAVTGVQAAFTLGSVSVMSDAIVPVTGVQATGYVGNVLVWGLVNTSQTPNWTQIVN